MATGKELEQMADLLSDVDNSGQAAEYLAERVMELVESFRRRTYKYVTVSQDRSRPAGNPARVFHPTWVRGPYMTLAEAATAANAERRAWREAGKAVKVMTAQVFMPDESIDPDSLEEVIR